MNQPQPPAFDPGQMLGQLMDPHIWNTLSLLPPASARRVVTVLLEEVMALSLSPPQRQQHEQIILANSRWLGVEIKPSRERAFVQRHNRLMAQRQAEELLMIFGDVPAQVHWAEQTFVAKGLSHARKVAAADRGAIVVSAHLGPLVYYIPMLAFFLSRAGIQPDLLAIMNAPPPQQEQMMHQQLESFAQHHRGRVELLAKKPGGENALLHSILKALQRKSWVLMQVDVVSGGRSQRLLPFVGKQLRLPGVWGAVRLAGRRQVPLLPVITWRSRNNGLAMRVEAPINVEQEQLERGAEQLAQVLQRWVLRDPADWGMLSKLHYLIPKAGSHLSPETTNS